MAYTTLATQSAGQTASAAGWANVVKANFDALLSYKKMKAADQTVNNSTTLVNDADFSFPVGINEKWAVNLVLRADVKTASDFKFFWTAPVGTTFRSMVTYSSPTAQISWGSAAQALTAPTDPEFPVLISAFFLVGGTAGTVQWQWAQNIAVAENTSVKAGSNMVAEKCE